MGWFGWFGFHKKTFVTISWTLYDRYDIEISNINPISAGVLENQVKFLPQFKKMGWFGFHKKILVTNFLDALR